jgi:hypothetical protein
LMPHTSKLIEGRAQSSMCMGVPDPVFATIPKVVETPNTSRWKFLFQGGQETKKEARQATGSMVCGPTGGFINPQDSPATPLCFRNSKVEEHSLL